MKTIQVCNTCGSPRILLDAYVNINDQDDVRIYDNAVCEDCDADGCNITVAVAVPDDFDCATDTFFLGALK